MSVPRPSRTLRRAGITRRLHRGASDAVDLEIEIFPSPHYPNVPLRRAGSAPEPDRYRSLESSLNEPPIASESEYRGRNRFIAAAVPNPAASSTNNEE
jgi:hypothetical protein